MATQSVSAQDVFRQLWFAVGLREDDVSGGVTIHGADPVVPSIHRVGAATAGALAAHGAAIAAIWRLRGGEPQDVSVDLKRAVVPGLQTLMHCYQNGQRIPALPRSGDRQAFFRSADDRLVYLLRTTAYPDLILRMVDLLGCGYSADAVSRTVARWKAVDLENALAERKAIGVIARAREEWLDHPQGQWLAARPPVEVERIGASDPEPFAPGQRPLDGVRVLDMTHVLAGPTISRVLAEQGAEVLHISSPHRSDPHVMHIDTGWGKRFALLDIEQADDIATLQGLAGKSDIFVQSWRPGVLERAGFGAQDLARRRPGIIYVSVSCYGDGGPWRTRGGFEPLGQTACGLVVDEGSLAEPRMAPTGTLNDYLVAYLAAAGVAAALIRRSRDGGSYHVKVSLTRTSMFLQELGRLTAGEVEHMPDAVPPPDSQSFINRASVYGELRVPGPLIRYSRTPPYWDRAPMPAGAHRAEW